MADETPEEKAAREAAAAADAAQETFPRAYVEELRQEAAANRVKAARAEELSKSLFHARVAGLGKLEDPTDLVYDEALLEDADALTAAVDGLLASKPHLARRVVAGDVGAGAGGAQTGAVSLTGMLADRT